MPKKLSIRQHSLDQPYEETVMEDLKENLEMTYEERYEMMISLNEFTFQVLKARGIKPLDEREEDDRTVQVISLTEELKTKLKPKRE